MPRTKQLQVFPTVKRPTKVQIEKCLQRFMNGAAKTELNENQLRDLVDQGKTFADLMLEMRAMDSECHIYYHNTLDRNLSIALKNKKA